MQGSGLLLLIRVASLIVNAASVGFIQGLECDDECACSWIRRRNIRETDFK